MSEKFHDDYVAAAEYFEKRMTIDDVYEIKQLLSEIEEAPELARDYLERRCRNVRELEEFFNDNSDAFFVENKRICLIHAPRHMGADIAVDYFQNVIEVLGEPVKYLTLKEEHMGKAPDVVRQFILGFYPNREFKLFFKSRPNKFFVDKEGKVLLIEVESVKFFKEKLKMHGKNSPRYMAFRGNVGQAPPHVQAYINKYYPCEDFDLFLRKHDDVFVVNDGYVSLVMPQQ